MQTPSPYLKSLKVLHFALLVGQLLFAAIVAFLLFVKGAKSTGLSDYPNEILIASIAVGVILFFASNAVFRKRIEPLRESAMSVDEKLERYRAASIVRWAMLEFPTLLSIILLFLSGNNQLLIVVVLMILLFISVRPQVQKISEQLNISPAEIEEQPAR